VNLRFLHLVRRNFLVWRKLMLSSLLGNLADPLVYLVGLGFGLGAFMPRMGGVSYIAFLAGGMICYSTMNSASFEALYSAFARLKIQRTWESILNAPMTIQDVVLGEWIWAGLKSALSGTAILVVMYCLGLVHGWRPLGVLPVVLLVGLAFAGLALVATALARSYDFFTYYFTLLVTPMMFVSGVFFPVGSLPAPVRALAAVLPLSHAVTLARALTLDTPLEGVAVHVAVLILYGVTGVSMAAVLIRRRLMR